MIRRISLLCAVLFSGCSVGPIYESPALEVADNWSLPSVDTAVAELDVWWESFHDPVLNRLVESARTQNLSVQQAIARVSEARARRDGAVGGRYPSVNAQGQLARRQLSDNGALPVGRIPNFDRLQTIHDLGFDASWELDLFGRTRSRVDAAEARLDQASAEAADVRLMVTAEVARNYVELRGAQEELAARESSVAASGRTLDLVETQHRVGEVSAAEVARAQAELAVQRTDLPRLRSRIRSAALALGALLGQLPETELALLGGQTPLSELTPVPVGERADLLRRRPDVRIAERRLAAATAEVGLSTAELFPKLTFGASGGFEALDADDLFESASEFWSLSSVLSWRVFEGGRVRAEIRASEARNEQAALAYESTVINALTEAEQGLSRYQFSLERLELQNQAVDAATTSHRFADARYQVGDTSLLELLDAERTLSQARQSYAVTHTEAAISLVSLFKALGGGWDIASRP